MPTKTLQQAILYFSDEDVCIEFLAKMRWPDGPRCPRCNSTKVSWLANVRRWQCKTCRKQSSVKVGTIFEESPIPLSTWLPAMWLLASNKNGISSYELMRGFGVTQKTAWFMLQRLRLAMQDDGQGMFSGKVEVDETFIGGKARFMHPHKRAEKITGTGGMGKAAVMGLLERHGPDGHSRVKAKVVKNVKRKTLAPEVRQQVTPGSEIFSDALKSYNDLDTDFAHQVIDHAEKYVEGQVHTNGLENFWSLLKRCIKGTYVSVEPFHLFRYIDEESFRFNTRKLEDGERFERIMGKVSGKRLTYRELIGGPS